MNQSNNDENNDNIMNQNTNNQIHNISNKTSQELITKIQDIIDKHSNDANLLKLFLSNLESLEENTIEQYKTIQERELRKTILDSEKDCFVKMFLSKYQFYHISDSDIFIEYFKNNDEIMSYCIVNENDIWCLIYKEIKQFNDILHVWKQKIRIEIISKIKKTSLLNAIPDTNTIQRILNLFSACITPNKEYSKYLLSIIGDSLHKKQIDNIYIIDTQLNNFLQYLQHLISNFVRCNFHTNFKLKYYNQNYEKIRIIRHNENIDKTFLWQSQINDHIFDIIAVSAHYSNRFQNNETFILDNCYCNETQSHVLYLKNNTKYSIVNDFSKSYIDSTNSLNINITHNEMIYLFKQYLLELNLPKIMFHSEFIQELKKTYDYNEDENIFVNVTSNRLSYVKIIMDFINSTFIPIDDVISNKTICDNHYYEVSEILDIFKQWKSNNEYYKDIQLNYSHINEKLFSSIITHFYNFEIKNDRYIFGQMCTLWNKIDDLTNYKNTPNDSITSIVNNENYDFINGTNNDNNNEILNNYKLYCSITKHNNLEKIVSKNYFEEIFPNV